MSSAERRAVESLIDLISTAETARVLGVHKATVCRWHERGRLPGIRVGDGDNGFLVFDRSDVLELQRRRVAGLRRVLEEVPC